MNVKVKNLSGGISIVIIDEPKTYNSLSFKNLNDLIKVFKKLDKDNKTKVIKLKFFEKYLKLMLTMCVCYNE